MKELFQGIIEQSLDDLFDENEREKTWRWFNYKGPRTDITLITFQDACDLGEMEQDRMRERARKLYYGEVLEHVYKEAKKFKNTKTLEIVETSPVLADYREFERTSYLTAAEASDYSATL
jgi:hypothetical protein